ncbi:hypothetical protein [Paenibacillus oryzisoli]|uniref:hypothetical protein n=1 Tax=Paenibacillus oryzisoli TaxID=1850517 RepID=UPI001EFBC94C|nr:hypothetical protein [Paenibacillus oryzisoli]
MGIFQVLIFTPAVTIVFMVRGDMTARDSLYYIVIQFAAANAESYTLRLLFGNIANLSATLPNSTEGQSFMVKQSKASLVWQLEAQLDSWQCLLVL